MAEKVNQELRAEYRKLKKQFDVSKFGTREATLDAAVIASLSQLSRQKASSIQGNFFHFNPQEFVESIKSYVNEESLVSISATGWETLGLNAMNYTKSVSYASYLYGTFEEKERPVKKKITKEHVNVDKSQKFSQPERLLEIPANSQEGTTEEVDRVLKLLVRMYKKNNGNFCLLT
ncbi:MAG: Non-structural maintenance of chromosomes element 4 A [Paramarteilia canceri]